MMYQIVEIIKQNLLALNAIAHSQAHLQFARAYA